MPRFRTFIPCFLAGLLAACAPSGLLNSQGNFVPNPSHALPTFARSREQPPDRWIERNENGVSICDFKYAPDGEMTGSTCYDSTTHARRTTTRKFDTATVYVFTRNTVEIEPQGGELQRDRNHLVAYLDKPRRCIVRETYNEANVMRFRDVEFLDDSLRVRKTVGTGDGLDSSVFNYAGFLPLRKTCWKRDRVQRVETFVYSEQPKIERIEVCFTDLPACSHRRDVWYKYGE